MSASSGPDDYHYLPNNPYRTTFTNIKHHPTIGQQKTLMIFANFECFYPKMLVLWAEIVLLVVDKILNHYFLTNILTVIQIVALAATLSLHSLPLHLLSMSNPAMRQETPSLKGA
jgi:hypothetical protein